MCHYTCLFVCLLFVFEAESHHVVVTGLEHIFKDVPLSSEKESSRH